MASDSGATVRPLSSIELLCWALAGLVLTGGILAGILIKVNSVVWWQAFVAASACASIAAIAGLLPFVLVIVRKQPLLMPMAIMAGVGIRMFTAVGLMFVAVKGLGFPSFETAILVLVYYAVMLATEVGVLVRGLKRAYPYPSSVPSSVPATVAATVAAPVPGRMIST